MTNAQALGAQVWSVPWSPAAQFKSNGSVNGGSFVGNAANYQAYANQQAGYVANMKSQYGVSLYAISVQNEPDANVTTYESCNWTAQQIHDFVPYLYNALANNGVSSTKIMIPESQNWPDYQGLAATAMSDSTSNMVGIIADHNYDGTYGPATLTKNSYGKALWQTEVATFDTLNASIANGVYWAGRIHAFLTVAQVNAWHYWWLVSQNPDNEGLTDANGIPAKRMYVLGQYSRFVRPGYSRVSANTSGSALLVTAFKDANSNFVIVAVNTNRNIDVAQTFSLANFPAVGSVTPWITSSTNSLANQPAITVNNSSFTYTNPALSVVTFVGQATSTPGVVLQLTPVADQTVTPGITLVVTNTAIDQTVPPKTLAFGLLGGPTNASLAKITPTNALFTWQPLVSQANTTNVISVVVTNNSTSLRATNSFRVRVNPLAQPRFTSINPSGGQINLALTGTTGPNYTLLTSTNLVTWQTLYTATSPPLPITLVVTNTRDRMRFYRIQAGP
jgi:O-glycosyl hydrolase